MSKHEIIPVIGETEKLQGCDTDKELESVLRYAEGAMWDAVGLGRENAGRCAPFPRLVITNAEGHRYIIAKVVTKIGRCELHIEKCCLKPSTPVEDAEEA